MKVSRWLQQKQPPREGPTAPPEAGLQATRWPPEPMCLKSNKSR